LASKLDELGFAVEWKEDRIEVKGKAANAMIPEEGINAFARLCIAFCAIGFESSAINFIAQEIAEDPNASHVFGDCSDKPSGKLRVNVGMIYLGEKEQISINALIPVKVFKEEIVKKLSAVAVAYGLEYKELD
jgi:hypothetical protein